MLTYPFKQDTYKYSPTLSTGGSTEEWSYFVTRWQDYANATKIASKETVIQLLECCDEHLRNDLTRKLWITLAENPGFPR
jgi:hypothetical protein